MFMVFGLLLQSAAGTTTRAAVLASDTQTQECVIQQSLDFAQQTVEQAPDHLVQGVEATSSQDCINGSCSGVTCHCPCHGMTAALSLPPVMALEPPAAVDAAWPVGGLASLGVIPPVRPPKI